MIHGCNNEEEFTDLKSVPEKDGKTRIYLLMIDGDVMYVGQSVNMRARIYDHDHSGKVFDRVVCAECEHEEANTLEAINIVRLNPPLNGNLPPNSVYISSKAATELIVEKARCLSLFAPAGRGHFYMRVSDVDNIILSVQSHGEQLIDQAHKREIKRG